MQKKETNTKTAGRSDGRRRTTRQANILPVALPSLDFPIHCDCPYKYSIYQILCPISLQSFVVVQQTHSFILFVSCSLYTTTIPPPPPPPSPLHSFPYIHSLIHNSFDIDEKYVLVGQMPIMFDRRVKIKSKVIQHFLYAYVHIWNANFK